MAAHSLVGMEFLDGVAHMPMDTVRALCCMDPDAAGLDKLAHWMRTLPAAQHRK